MQLRISPIVYEDLQGIRKYIEEELANPDAATNIVLGIIESYERLAEFPMLGAKLSNIIDVESGYRFLISNGYMIFYLFTDEWGEIIRVLHGKRDYASIFSEAQE